MDKVKKNQRWVPGDNVEGTNAANGVFRKVLAYCDSMMCVENHFDKGAVASHHSHPHVQITYVIEGEFKFEIDGEEKLIKKGDSLLIQENVEHECTCIEKGVVLDIFNPMREDFVD